MTNAELRDLVRATIQARLEGGAVDAMQIDGVDLQLAPITTLSQLEDKYSRLAAFDERDEQGGGVSYAGFGRMT